MSFRSIVRCMSQTAEKKNVRVSLLGADTLIGSAVAFQLKMWCVAPEIKVHGSSPVVRDIADDLNQIPTSTRIIPFSGPNQIKPALTKADVVLVYSEDKCKGQEVGADTIFLTNAPIVENIAKLCVTVCPNAIFALLTPPLNSTVPLFAQVLRDNGVFKTSKLLGIVSDMSMTTKKLVAKTLGLNPKAVWVPMTGGASPSTLVPVIASAKPGGVFLSKIAKEITKNVCCIRKDLKANKDEPAGYAAGYAIADFIRAICRGLKGDDSECHSALIRTRLIDGLDYLVLPVHFGPNGVSEVHGIPDLNPGDMKRMDAAIKEMVIELERSKNFSAKKRTACVACNTPAIPEYNPACSF